MPGAWPPRSVEDPDRDEPRLLRERHDLAQLLLGLGEVLLQLDRAVAELVEPITDLVLAGASVDGHAEAAPALVAHVAEGAPRLEHGGDAREHDLPFVLGEEEHVL